MPKRFNLIFDHFHGMPLLVKQYEAFNPLNIRFFSLLGIAFESNYRANLIKEFYFIHHFCPPKLKNQLKKFILNKVSILLEIWGLTLLGVDTMKVSRLAILVFFMLLIAVLIPFGSDSGSFTDKLTMGLDILATLTAAGGLLGLLLQFKRERDLSEADFTLRLNHRFMFNEHISRIYKMLEDSKVSEQKENPFSDDEDLIDMANYLSFFGPFWGLIERNVISIEMIDILAYRFFLSTNNRFMQDKLLCHEGKEIAWHNIYHLHQIWKSYREEKNLPVWQEDKFGLSKTALYTLITSNDS